MYARFGDKIKTTCLLESLLIKLYHKALRLVNFQPLNAPASPLYQEYKTPKITGIMKCKNILFIRNSLRKENLPIFN